MRPETQDALARYLLTLGDDELVLGYRDSEWTGVAPMVEEDIAFSSLAQDEIGHARLYYTLAAELTGTDVDHLALARPKDQYYHARLLELRAAPRYDPAGRFLEGGDWAKAIARRFLYDLFDDLRNELLVRSGYAPLAGAVGKIRREEQYHLRHGRVWWQSLAEGSLESSSRLVLALEALWPDLLGLFEDAPGEDLLCAEGVLPGLTSSLLDPWLDRSAPHFDRYGLPLPADNVDGRWHVAVRPLRGGRIGRHGPGWDELHDEMTMVRRLEPEGVW